MTYTKQIISKVEDIVSSAECGKRKGHVKNYLLLISKPSESFYMKPGVQYGLLDNTHQLIYHFNASKKLFSFIYEDTKGISHIKWPLCSAIFPENVSYRDFLVSILDRFWTTDEEFLSSSSIFSLENHLVNMFTELKADVVLLDGTTNLFINKLGKEREGFEKLLVLLNEKLKVSVILMANRKDEKSIDFDSLASQAGKVIELVKPKENQ